jgi:Spy/CpxP family protein refolding chaperone
MLDAGAVTGSWQICDKSVFTATGAENSVRPAKIFGTVIDLSPLERADATTVPSNEVASGCADRQEEDMGRFRTVIAGVAVVGLLATGMVFAQGPRGGPGGRGRGDGFGPGGLGLPLRQLNLTEAQRAQIEQIRDQHRADMQTAMKKLATARQAQRAAIESVPADEATITSLTQDLTQAEVDVAIHTARLNTAVWNVLTEAQRAELTKLRAERQTRAGGRGERR